MHTIVSFIPTYKDIVLHAGLVLTVLWHFVLLIRFLILPGSEGFIAFFDVHVLKTTNTIFHVYLLPEIGIFQKTGWFLFFFGF